MGAMLNRARLAITLAIAVAAAFTAVGFASTSQGSGHVRELKAFVVATASTQVDVDGDGKFSVGDEVIGQATDYDRRGGTQIGTGTFVCVVVDATAGNFDCQGSDVLAGGEIREAGQALGSDPTHVRWAITGGTGKYMGIGGQIDGTFTNAQLTEADFTFTILRH
jgi:hypothetical protein